jgi:SAM-dependent methyltransferase
MKKLKFNSDKLNLGCGMFKKKGFVNVDFVSACKPDVLHNLNKIPYPFEDNSFSYIEANHLLEHLSSPMEVMQELRRILKPNGKLIIRVPHFSRGFSHPEHIRGFDVSFPLYFDENFRGGYSGTSFKLQEMRLSWFAQPYLKKVTLPCYQYLFGVVMGGIFSFFANLSPYFCSRMWCFLVGGFEEIEFVFKK